VIVTSAFRFEPVPDLDLLVAEEMRRSFSEVCRFTFDV
jgi:hypothetical protein